MIDLKANLSSIQERIAQACRHAGRSPGEVTMVAVTKGMAASVISEAFDLGIRDFGENRVQEAADKIGQLFCMTPQPAWHMVGHLQSNKVKTALSMFDIIHSVDSVRLAQAISSQASKPVSVLLQVNVSGEASKSGFSLPEIGKAFEALSCLSMLEIKGLMTIAPAVADAEEVRPVFKKLRELRDFFHLEHLSMGMTDDFEVAIEEGATMVRIGRALFGERG